MTDKSAMMEKLDAHHLLLDGSAAPEANSSCNERKHHDGISGAGCLLAA